MPDLDSVHSTAPVYDGAEVGSQGRTHGPAAGHGRGVATEIIGLGEVAAGSTVSSGGWPMAPVLPTLTWE